MNHRLAQMLEASRLTSRARLADMTASLGGGTNHLPDMQALLSRLPGGLRRLGAQWSRSTPNVSILAPMPRCFGGIRPLLRPACAQSRSEMGGLARGRRGCKVSVACQRFHVEP